MRKRIKISATIVILFCLVVAIPAVSIADDYEPDDVMAVAQWITVGNEFQNHEIDPATDTDWVKFDAVEGYGYVIELANESAGNVYCHLYNENGNLLISSIDTHKEWLCPLTGTYYLLIWESGQNNVCSYQVRILPSYWNGAAVWNSNYEPDDNWYNAYLIRTDGTVYHHDNSNAADFDWVRFTAEEGRTYTFLLTNETGGNYYFDVYDAGYRGLSGSQTNIWTWTCPSSGTYYVRMWEYQHNQIGTFDFRITGDEVDYAIDLPMSHVTLYLDTTYGVDSYQLMANCSNGSDDIVWSSSNSSVVSVGPDGLLDAQGVGTALVTATCTISGTSDNVIVTVNADDYENNDVQVQAKPISVGIEYQSHQLTPNSSDPDQFDWVKFDAVEGCGYVIELANESAGDVYCNLYNENGDAVTGTISTRQEWLCPFTGTYYLRIWENGHNHWTSYQVRILSAYWNGTAVWNSEYEPDGNWYNAYLIRTDGTVYHHDNSNAADFDWVRFTAEEGRTYTFSLTNETGGNYYFDVYDAGYRGLSGSQTNIWTWTCPSSGTYYVRMWEYQHNQIGTFDFRITGDEVDYAIDLPISHVTLYLDTAYGVDSYQLMANCSNGSDDIVWSSSNSSVVSVGSNGLLEAQGVGTAIVTATCTISGTSDDVIVTVNADDYENNDVQVQAKPISVGIEYQSHQLTPNSSDPDQFDWVKFDAVEGCGYVIELANESAGDVYCNLYNENGDAVTGTISTRQEWLCPFTGTYYLRIWENGHNHWTSYQVRILSAYWNGTAVWNSEYEPDGNWYNAYLIRTDGTVYHHDNSNAADFDWVRFTAEEGRTYTFSLTNETGGNYYFDVYDAGYRGLSGSQTNIWTWTCPSSGTYYVRMWEYQHNQIGTFDFRITGDEVDYAIDLPISHVTLYLDTAYGVDSYQLMANCSNGSDDIVWSSSNSSVVSVGSNGLLEAQGVGTAIVTATCTISGTSDDVIVTVNADDYENNDVQVQAKPISVGIEYQSHQLTPNSSDPDLYDWVKFDAVEGYGYVIELANESAGNVYCHLYDENGNLLISSINTRQEWLCPLTGTYYLIMWEYGNDQWTSYQVRVLPSYWNGTAVWDSEYEPDDNWYNAYLIRTDGTVYHHDNSNAADFDWVRFTAEEGRTYTFSLTNERGGDYYFDVYDAGYRGLSGSQTNIWTWTCPISGTYYVRMWDYQQNQIGTFDFRITGNEVDYAIDIPTSHVTLYLDTAYGVDSYQLVANCSNGSDDIVWSSTDSSVVSVGSNGLLEAQGVGTALVTATCTISGTSDDVIVTVNADDYEYNDVQVQAKPISVGIEYQSHQLTPNSSDPDLYDWVKFDAVEGYGYVIELANESAGNVYCHLYDEDNLLISSIDTHKEWKCPFTGTYYLQIWENGNDQWTSYQVRILPAYWNGTAVWDSEYEANDTGYTSCFICTDNSSQHGYNEEYDDLDWFRFYAVQGSTYVLSLTNELGGNFYFILYDNKFAAISGSQNTNMPWTCPVTGLYHVRIWDYSTDQIGSYDFSIDGEPIAVDSDGDGMNDCWEIFYFGIGNLNRDGTGDWDGDGLSDKGEFDNSTDPKDVDTDDDNMPDGWEVANHLNPLVNDAFDHKDNDGFCNWREYLAGTDPNDPEDIPGNIDIYVDDDNTSGIEDGSVSNPFNTAQDGVNFSGPGDIVYVAAGAYVENVLIERSISLIGDGADVTIIDGSGSAQPAVCYTALDGGSIEGFRIQHGTQAGIRCEQSTLSIRENIISNTSSGHGIEIDTGSSVTIENNIIYDNDLHGIDFQGVAATIMNNTIVSNKDDGIGCSSGGVMIKNNIIVSNEDHGISCNQLPEQISYNNVWENMAGDYFGCSSGTGDISGDPQFEDSVIYDFHITTGSPCIDAGASDGVPEFDFDGNGRYDDPNTEPNTGGGTETYYDMGAYEYFPACKGDFDKDGDVDGSDLVVFADAFGSSSGGPDYNPVADFDSDGFVDESDLATFAAEFGRTACSICP